MNSRNLGVLFLIWLHHFLEAVAVNRNVAIARGFLVYRPTSITRGMCSCSMPFSCSCCRKVVILYTKKEKDLCVNFTYQRNGLNVDVTLSSDTISTRTVTSYQALQFCVFIPGCLFSNTCVNILQLNQFSKSISACLRLDIYAKKQLWQINYDCISVSTDLPMMSSEGMSMNGNGRTGGSPESTTQMMSTEATTMGMTERDTEDTTQMTEQTNGMTEMMEMNSEQAGQMTID